VLSLKLDATSYNALSFSFIKYVTLLLTKKNVKMVWIYLKIRLTNINQAYLIKINFIKFVLNITYIKWFSFTKRYLGNNGKFVVGPLLCLYWAF